MRSFQRFVLPGLVCLTLLIAVVGCGSAERQPVKVTGTVKYSDGTIPQGEVAVIRFEPASLATGQVDGQTKAASGTIQTDGSFQLSTLGENDGRLRGDLEAEHPGAGRWIFDVPGCEPYAAVTARLESWLATLPPEPDRRIIAVSHGVTGRVLRGLYAGYGQDRTAEQDVPQDAVFLLRNGEVGRIDCEPLD